MSAIRRRAAAGRPHAARTVDRAVAPPLRAARRLRAPRRDQRGATQPTTPTSGTPAWCTTGSSSTTTRTATRRTTSSSTSGAPTPTRDRRSRSRSHAAPVCPSRWSSRRTNRSSAPTGTRSSRRCSTTRSRCTKRSSHATKVDLLARARAMIFPIQWPEPFGLVMAEAMACGTPVVACPAGAAVELVENGVTGYLRDSIDDLVDAVGERRQLLAARVPRTGGGELQRRRRWSRATSASSKHSSGAIHAEPAREISTTHGSANTIGGHGERAAPRDRQPARRRRRHRRSSAASISPWPRARSTP